MNEGFGQSCSPPFRNSGHECRGKGNHADSAHVPQLMKTQEFRETVGICWLAIGLSFSICLSGCIHNQSQTGALTSYPQIPPVAMDVDWFSASKPSPLELQYVKWVNGPGSTNVEFQRWLVNGLSRNTALASLSAQYDDWKRWPGNTNVQFQQWLRSASITGSGGNK